MARLPTPGSDSGTWGVILNEYLTQALKADGTIKDNAVTSSAIAPNAVTSDALAPNTVNAASIADGSITNILLADATIQEAKLSNAVQTKLNALASTPDWDTITNKPAVIAAGADQAAARSAIGAGTSNLTLAGTGSATTAAKSDHTQAASTISDSTTIGRAILTAADASAVKTSLSLVKSDVGLGSVDNTSDATKNSAIATLTNKTLTTPIISYIAGATGGVGIEVAGPASPASWIKINSNTAGNSPYIEVISSDANANLELNSKGNGVVRANGAEVVTTASSQMLTNKTFSTPIINGDITQSGDRPFLISNHTGSSGFAGGMKWQQSGTSQLEMLYDTSSNVLNLWNTSGSDTGAHFMYDREGYLFIGSGSGIDQSTRLKISDSRSTATSGDVKGMLSEVYINPSSSATTRAWGVHFVGGTKSDSTQDLTGTDALMGFEGKAQHNGTGTVAGANGGLLYIDNSSTGTITTARSLNLFPMANGGGGTITNAYHLVVSQLPNFTANGQTRIAIDVVASMPNPGVYTGTTVAALRLNGDQGVRDGILFAGDTTLYRSASDTLKTDDNFIVGAPGTASGSVTTIDGAQTLTNKTFAGPKIDQVNDTNGNNILDYHAIPGSVNNLYITNQSAGNYPTIGVAGSDTDIGIALAPKNNGSVNLFGNAPTIAASGGYNGGNLNLNLKSQGTGAVQANGIPVMASKMMNPFYTDPNRFEPWPQMMCNGGNWMLNSGDMPMTFFTPAVDMIVSNIITMAWDDSTQAGASACRVAIFRVNDLNAWPADMTCIARSAHKADRWNGSVLDTAPIVDNGAASPSVISSVNLTAGQQYAVSYMSVGHTGSVKLSALGTFRKNTFEPHISFFGGGGYSDIPVNLTGGWVEEWTHIWFALT